MIVAVFGVILLEIFSFSSEITKNVTMVLSLQSDQFCRDNTILCGYLELFGLITCNETEGLTTSDKVRWRALI